MKKRVFWGILTFVVVLFLFSVVYTVSFWQAAGNVEASDLLTCRISYLENDYFVFQNNPYEPDSDVYQQILSTLTTIRYKPCFLSNTLEDKGAFYDDTGNMIVLQFKQAESGQSITVIVGLEDEKNVRICNKDYRVSKGFANGDSLFEEIAEIVSTQMQDTISS